MGIDDDQARFQWHPRVHTQWGKERLYFWRLRFLPAYHRKTAVDALLKILKDRNVNAYTIYELFGEWDLMVRLWLPRETTSVELGAAVSEMVKQVGLHDEDHFSVDDIVRHWVWGAGTELERPSDTRMLDAPPPDDEIAQINKLSPDTELVARLESENLLRSVSHHPGIKFAMVVTAPVANPPIKQRHRLLKELTRIVDGADEILERSLYQGHGLGSFLILGRVLEGRFDAIRTQIADKITDGIDPESIGARTYTMIVASQDSLDVRDVLRPQHDIRAAEEVSVEDALQQPESDTLEVKASAFTDYDRVLHGDGESNENDVADRGVLKAVTAMLNSGGGTVVIGALEARRYARDAQALGDPLAIGDYLCVGVQRDFGNDHDWDHYARRLLAIIGQRIDPGPHLWINLTREAVDGVAMAKITIAAPDRHWYYQQGKHFYVRRGSESIELLGTEADRYRHERPRG
jgi:hypothetical protein